MAEQQEVKLRTFIADLELNLDRVRYVGTDAVVFHIIGSTGVGKSTIVNRMLQWRDPKAPWLDDDYLCTGQYADEDDEEEDQIVPPVTSNPPAKAEKGIYSITLMPEVFCDSVMVNDSSGSAEGGKKDQYLYCDTPGFRQHKYGGGINMQPISFEQLLAMQLIVDHCESRRHVIVVTVSYNDFKFERLSELLVALIRLFPNGDPVHYAKNIVLAVTSASPPSHLAYGRKNKAKRESEIARGFQELAQQSRRLLGTMQKSLDEILNPPPGPFSWSKKDEVQPSGASEQQGNQEPLLPFVDYFYGRVPDHESLERIVKEDIESWRNELKNTCEKDSQENKKWGLRSPTDVSKGIAILEVLKDRLVMVDAKDAREQLHSLGQQALPLPAGTLNFLGGLAQRTIEHARLHHAVNEKWCNRLHLARSRSGCLYRLAETEEIWPLHLQTSEREKAVANITCSEKDRAEIDDLRRNLGEKVKAVTEMGIVDRGIDAEAQRVQDAWVESWKALNAALVADEQNSLFRSRVIAALSPILHVPHNTTVANGKPKESRHNGLPVAGLKGDQ